MVVLRCTQRLLRRLHVAPVSNGRLRSSSPLGDWYATPFSVGHLRAVLCVSEKSRLPLFVKSQSVAGLLPGLRETVVTVLRELGVAASALQREEQHLADVAIGSTVNRSVLGSLTDFGLLARYRMKATSTTDLVALAVALAETPCGPLGYESPEDVARALLATA
jgi:hypothetical protein